VTRNKIRLGAIAGAVAIASALASAMPAAATRLACWICLALAWGPLARLWGWTTNPG